MNIVIIQIDIEIYKEDLLGTLQENSANAMIARFIKRAISDSRIKLLLIFHNQACRRSRGCYLVCLPDRLSTCW